MNDLEDIEEQLKLVKCPPLRSGGLAALKLGAEGVEAYLGLIKVYNTWVRSNTDEAVAIREGEYVDPGTTELDAQSKELAEAGGNYVAPLSEYDDKVRIWAALTVAAWLALSDVEKHSKRIRYYAATGEEPPPYGA